MIKQVAFISLILFFFGCSTSDKEESRAVPSDTYRPAGFHAYLKHGKKNAPISLVKADSSYHLFYTTGIDEWGHLSSKNLINWSPEASVPIPSIGYGEVIWDEFNTSNLDAPWIALVKDADEINLIFSRDGNEWEEYNDNPLLQAAGKYPSVSWNPDLEQWILTLANDNEISIYTSDDLLNWNSQSTITAESNVERAHLFKLDDTWVTLLMGDKLVYQSGTFDGKIFIKGADLNANLGIRTDGAVLLSSIDETILIAGNSNEQGPAFHTPLGLTYEQGVPRILPTESLLKESVGMVRGKLSKLITDGPSWYSFTIEKDFELLEIVVSDATTQAIITWNVTEESLTIDGSAIPEENINYTLKSRPFFENLIIDIIIDHTTIDLVIDNGAFTSSIVAIPQTFFSKIQVSLDGEMYEAKGVLYEIGL